jgi:hypothetical protein
MWVNHSCKVAGRIFENGEDYVLGVGEFWIGKLKIGV